MYCTLDKYTIKEILRAKTVSLTILNILIKPDFLNDNSVFILFRVERMYKSEVTLFIKRGNK